GCKLVIPHEVSSRPECGCYLSHDIGQYDSCMHGCRYCYANNDRGAVLRNYAMHDEKSSLLIGHLKETDIIKEAKQVSFKERQLSLF
ncbi:MAG: DUF1848 family protein, partial [Erysipelotrichaceae bacterium]|nr:DUF1848 family protein [Erysipelotrichaceae bacterium]